MREGCGWTPPGRSLVFTDLRHLLEQTLSMDLGLILCEGGPRLATALLNAGLVDRFSLFTAPKLLGGSGIPVFHDLRVTGIEGALVLGDPQIHLLDGDILVEGRFVHRTD